jgi:hypothetical protein
MKYIITLFASALVGFSSVGQSVPNGDFSGAPFNWKGGTAGGSLSITGAGSRDIIHGEDTITVESVGPGGFAILRNNPGKYAAVYQEFPYTQRPDFFQLNYNYFAAGVDEIGAAIIRFTKYNTTTMQSDIILLDTILFTETSYPWKLAKLDLTNLYQSSENPDTAYVGFFSSVGATATAGTTLIIDDIDLTSASTSTKDLFTGLSGVPKLSPNPMVSNASISYELNESSDINIQVFDINGKLVKEVLNENQISGSHSIDFNVSDLKSGFYFVKFSSGDYRFDEKIVVSK